MAMFDTFPTDARVMRVLLASGVCGLASLLGCSSGTGAPDDENGAETEDGDEATSPADAGHDADDAGADGAGEGDDDGEDMSSGGAMTDDPAYVLGYEVAMLDGTPASLSAYRGKVVLVVNTASKCGFTPQYAGLESLYRSRKDSGLVVLGFPSGSFGGQEFGTNEEIASFCEERFDVSFPMFQKVSVKGGDAHPLFRQLAERTEAPRWNFTKWLVDKDGRVVASFGSGVAPDSAELTGRIDELLRG